MTVISLEQKVNELGDLLHKNRNKGLPIAMTPHSRNSQNAYQQKNDPSVTSASLQTMHGNNGLLAQAGVEPDLFSTVLHPIEGVASAMPVLPYGSATPDDPDYGGYEAPLYETITGITAEGDVSEAVNICDPFPQGGLLKACILTAPYARVGRSFNIREEELGKLVNRAEPTDLRVMNPILNPQSPFSSPMTMPSGAGGSINNLLNAKKLIAGTQLQRKMAPMVYTGDPANNTAGGGYKEFIGLQTLVNAGNKVHAINGTPCPSMDSIIDDFDFELVDGNGRDIVAHLNDVFYRLEYIAEQTGMGMPEFALAMRPQQFEEITRIYPLVYYQEMIGAMNAVNGAGFGGTVNLDGGMLTDYRDNMRTGKYLPIRGKRIPVILDTSIPELNSTTNAELAAGQFAADIYILAFRVMNMPVLWWEFFNTDNGQVRELLAEGRYVPAWSTDGGIFRWYFNFINGCYEFNFFCKPRIINRTPYLCARITNVSYQPATEHARSYDPASPYFFNGGATNSPTQRVYTEASGGTPVPVS